MRNKHRHIASITQDNDCKCHGCNRSKQQSRYNKSAKRQSSRIARQLDRFVILEQVVDNDIDYNVKSRNKWVL